MKLSFQNSFFALVSTAVLIAFFVVAKAILIPLGIALLLAFILFPVHKRFRNWGVGNIIAAFLSILLLVFIVGAGITFFSTEIIALSDELSNFGEKLTRLSPLM